MYKTRRSTLCQNPVYHLRSGRDWKAHLKFEKYTALWPITYSPPPYSCTRVRTLNPEDWSGVTSSTLPPRLHIKAYRSKVQLRRHLACSSARLRPSTGKILPKIYIPYRKKKESPAHQNLPAAFSGPPLIPVNKAICSQAGRPQSDGLRNYALTCDR